MFSVREKRRLGSIGAPIVVYGCGFLKTKKFQIIFLTELMDVTMSSSVRVFEGTHMKSPIVLYGKRILKKS